METIYRKRDGFGELSLYQRIGDDGILEVETVVEPTVCFYPMENVVSTSSNSPYEIGAGKYACSEEEFHNVCLVVLERLRHELHMGEQ